ncbi:hypothetical protein C8J56DRAFT_905393 [Mycena floridula]|nr:hypothetical protein C8J56DRAFT_905393 [Mycena floridula]
MPCYTPEFSVPASYGTSQLRNAIQTLLLLLLLLRWPPRLRATAQASTAGPVAAGIVVQASPLDFLANIPSTSQFSLTCNPITAGALSGGQCTANAICCNDNSHKNLMIAIITKASSVKNAGTG